MADETKKSVQLDGDGSTQDPAHLRKLMGKDQADAEAEMKRLKVELEKERIALAIKRQKDKMKKR